MGICISVASSEIHGIPQVHDENVMIFEASKVQNETKRLCSVYSKQGTKGLNQDAASLHQDYGMENGAFCGVYDGHGKNGHIVSKIVNNTLPSLILSQKNALEEIHTTKNGVDNKQNKFSNNYLRWKEAILGAFNVMDEEVKKQENLDCSCSGTTAVVVIRQVNKL
uniref:PPM-type phosphatase domain-containing protein n=1 Tax=Medicago truncatula TaxID=3880 RepID=I3SGT8_MEDTR|nr:unknown [Medicago truncatula]